MIISFTRKFIFVHIYRTGGTSVFHALSRKYDLRVALAGRPQEEWPACVASLGLNPALLNLDVHATAAAFRETLGEEIYNGFFKFCFVRNPWDHALSHYLYVRKHPGMTGHDKLIKYTSYRDYVLDRFSGDRTFSPQRNAIADTGGKIIVDYIGHFESVDEDFAKICDRLSLPNPRLSSCNETQHDTWAKHYDLEMFDLVKRGLAPDIEAFGYHTDPAAYGIGARALAI